ncbi:MAG: 2-hydroxy-3-oxopropionate reductase [Acidobacterium sp.]|nr:NAD(P)-dependent oxidoreductase [Acidobacteriota bacterium]PHY12213.1 MAG: 2-hydroxy-3-oxopropionate reductase [Acidobacterium sp.]
MSATIGFIGLGLMGKPMALNLLKKGFAVVVHSRSRGPVDELVAAGATAANSPAEVARAASKFVTMLPDGPDVSLVLEGATGIFSAMQPGTVILDSSTIAPATAKRLAAATAERGGQFLDGPVSGGEIGAIAGTLAFMIGGEAAAVEAMRPVIEAMGSPDKLVHVGDSGAGQVCKACNQIVLGGTMAVVAEAIALSRKAGVDPMKVRAALMGGFAQSRVLDVHGERMITGNWKPGFKARFFKKDLGIAMNTLAENGVPAYSSAVVQQLVQAQITAGEGEEDYSGLAKAIFKLAGLQ